MADNDSIFDELGGLGAGAGAAYWQYRKMQKAQVDGFKPSLDPRANILNRIQSLNVDTSFKSSVRQFNAQYIDSKLDALEDRLKRTRVNNIINANELLQIDHSVLPTGISNTARARTPSPQMFTREWQAALNATFPNTMEAKVFQSTNDPINAIRSTLKGNSSILMQRAFWTFQKNVNTLLGLGIEQPLAVMATNSFIKDRADASIGEGVRRSVLGKRLGDTIGEIETALDAKLQVTRRVGQAGVGEFIFTLPGRNKPLFTIAESFAAIENQAAGLIRTGAGLHNVYAPGIFGVADEAGDIIDEMTFSELKAQRILKSIQSNSLTAQSPGLMATVRGVSDEVAKLADYMEPNISGTGYSLETLFKADQITVFDKEGNPVTGDLRRKVAARNFNARYGAFTPAAAEGRFSILPPEYAYGPLANELDYARKPWQYIRQYTPTPEALALNKASALGGAEWDFLDSPLARDVVGGPSGARVKTLYLSEADTNMLQQRFGITIGDGELLLHESVKKKLAVTRMKRVNLNEINSKIVDKMLSGGVTLDNITEQVNLNIQLDPKKELETILGRNAEGALVKTKYPTSIVGVSPTLTKTMDKNTISSLDLITKETIEMTDIEKVFGGLKGLGRFVSGDKDALLGKALSSIGISLDDLDGVQAIARVGDLKDNARVKQAYVSHFMLNSKGGPSSASIVEAIKDMSLDDTHAYMSNLAAQHGGSVFNPKGTNIAVTQLHFGGEASLTGAGNIATLEPRVFTLLSGSNPGGMGEDVSNEILERMIRWAPGKITMHEELMKTLQSLNGELSPTGQVIAPSELKAAKAELMRTGGFISTGVESVPHMYIPGYETVPELHPRMVGTGALVDTSQPSKIFNEIIDDVLAVNSPGEDRISAEEFRTRFEARKSGYLTQLFQETAIAGKGAGSLARGQVPGARSLRVVSETNPMNQSAFEQTIRAADKRAHVQDRIIGVPAQQAEEMFNEMRQIYGSDAVSGMQKRFMEGELIAGMGMRHPTIGAYSMQPVLMKRIDTDVPAVIIPERYQDITIGNVTKKVQTGILPGMAADKDADTAAAILLSPNMEEKMRAQLLNEHSVLSQQMNSFRDHSIRMQLLKPKAQGDGISLADYASRRAAEATKLAISQEEVGKLSTALTKSRVAIMASNLPDDRKLTGLSLLEWLEQQPISGKHVSVTNALEGMFEKQMQALQAGAQGNPRMLSGAIASMTENLDDSLRGLMGSGAETSLGKVAGFGAFNDLGGPGQTIEDITSSINQFKALPSGAQLAAATKYATPSVGQSVGFSDLSTVLMANQINAGGGMADQSRNMLASINQSVSSAVNRARPFAKPALIGLAAAGAAMAILSPGPGTLPPPSERPQTKLTNQTRDDLEIPGITSQTLGNPTQAPLLAPETAQINNSSHDRRKSFRARIQANGVTAEQRARMVDRLNGRYPDSKINVRVQDDRKSLNRHSINDMID